MNPAKLPLASGGPAGPLDEQGQASCTGIGPEIVTGPWTTVKSKPFGMPKSAGISYVQARGIRSLISGHAQKAGKKKGLRPSPQPLELYGGRCRTRTCGLWLRSAIKGVSVNPHDSLQSQGWHGFVGNPRVIPGDTESHRLGRAMDTYMDTNPRRPL